MIILVAIVMLIVGVCLGGMLGLKLAIMIAKNKKLNEKKFLKYYKFTIELFRRKNQGIDVFKVIRDKGFSSVSIYGAAEMGVLVKQMMEKDGLDVKYFIDKRQAGKEIEGIKVYSTDKIIDDVDCVLITPYIYANEIINDLKIDDNSSIVLLDDLIKK